MLDLEIQPKIVGRDEELKELEKYLDKAQKKQGNTVFIPGEAGVGKTRLVNELKDIALSMGFKVLSGNSMYESLAPYMPFIEALRSGGLDHLFAEEAPRVESVYLMTHSGILIKEVIRHESELSPDIFASMLTGVSNFVNETLSILSGKEIEGTLNSLGYENYRILIESGKSANLVVILTGKENEFLLSDMKEILHKTEKSYGTLLEEWDGDEKKVKGTEEHLQPLITTGKYDGIYYGKEDPKARRNLLFENVSMGLMRQTEKTPTLLCIEDLHWADPSTLALMHYVARNTKKTGLLILGTFRPEDIAVTNGTGHPLINIMQLMNREDLQEELELRRLPKEDIAKFLSALLGITDFSNEFQNRIYNETEGNPLFIVQLVKFLVEENIIQTEDGKWRLTKNLEKINIPPKVYNVIERRLDRVEQEYRKVLDYASVVGETFDSTLLATILDMNRVQLLERLRYLEQTHRLIHPQNGNFKFDHAKIKEVLYSEIPEQLKLEYHSIIADSIETLSKDNLDEVIGDLAFHFYKGKDKEKALIYLIKAADKAAKHYANEEAIRYYSEALEFEENRQKRMEIFEAQGDIYKLTGDYNNSIEFYNNALDLCEVNRKRAGIMAKIGFINEKLGQYDEMLRICNEAVDIVRGEECKEKAYALNNIGTAYMRLGDYRRALESCENSLEIGRKIEDLRLMARILNTIGGVYLKKEEYEKAIEFYKKGIEVAEKSGNVQRIMIFTMNIGFSYLLQGIYDKALEYLEKSLKIQPLIGDKGGLAYILSGLAELHYEKGDLKNALDFTNRALELSKEKGLKEIIAESGRIFGMIYGKQENWEESIKNFEKSIRICKDIGLENELAHSHFAFGLMWKAKGDVDKTKEHFHQAYDIFENLNLERKMEKVKAECKAL